MPQQNESHGPAAQDRVTTSPSAGSGFEIAIRRNGRVVEITFQATDDYAGMQLYDMLVRSVEDGCLRLELKTRRSARRLLHHRSFLKDTARPCLSWA